MAREKNREIESRLDDVKAQVRGLERKLAMFEEGGSNVELNNDNNHNNNNNNMVVEDMPLSPSPNILKPIDKIPPASTKSTVDSDELEEWKTKAQYRQQELERLSGELSKGTNSVYAQTAYKISTAFREETTALDLERELKICKDAKRAEELLSSKYKTAFKDCAAQLKSLMAKLVREKKKKKEKKNEIIFLG